MPKTLEIISEKEYWDPLKEEFTHRVEGTITIEHSLYAISQWETKYRKSFFEEKTAPHTRDEIIDYIRFMTLGNVENNELYNRISNKTLNEALKYIDEKPTASTVKPNPKKGNKGQFLTTELIYSWLVGLQIPFECQYWNFNRMMILIEMCNNNNTPPDKMSKRQTAKNYKALNDARRKKLNTKG